MGILLIGLAITLLDFPLQLAESKVLDLTPDILGYLLIIFALHKLGRYSHKFTIAHKITMFAAIAAGAVFSTNLLVGTNAMSSVIILIGIAEMFLQVALLFTLAKSLQEMEQDYDLTLHSKWLKPVALGIGLGIILGYAGLLLPGLVMVGSLMMDVLQFAYLILFYFVWEALKNWQPPEEE